MKPLPLAALLLLLATPAARSSVDLPDVPTVQVPDWQGFLAQVAQDARDLHPDMPAVGDLAGPVVQQVFGPGGLVDTLPVEQFVALLPAGDCATAQDRVACVRDFVFGLVDIHFAANGLSPALSITKVDSQYKTFGFMVAGYGASIPLTDGSDKVSFGAGHWYVSLNG